MFHPTLQTASENILSRTSVCVEVKFNKNDIKKPININPTLTSRVRAMEVALT